MLIGRFLVHVSSCFRFRAGVDIVSPMPYFSPMKVFRWNVEKNGILARERGVTFEEIVERIESGCRVIDVEHPNKEKYPNQRILIVDLDGYAHMVPYVENEQEYFLKTIIPSRKATRKYLGGKNG